MSGVEVRVGCGHAALEARATHRRAVEYFRCTECNVLVPIANLRTYIELDGPCGSAYGTEA